MSDGPASPPCFAHELSEGLDGFEVVDAQTKSDVARWRKGERDRLIKARLAISAEERAGVAEHVIQALDRLIDPSANPVVSLYWPFRGELDLRAWMKRMSQGGAAVALPVVVAKAQPLVFREWTPGCKMERGIWNIPVPADDRRLVPEIVISPVVGADRSAYRLGYGGGFYDRTLAALPGRAWVIGVGHPIAEIKTIFPQPHDVPMDWMLLGETQWERPK